MMPGASSLPARAAQGDQPARAANVDGGSIVANNIITDFGLGQTRWIWGEENNGRSIRFDHGQVPENPPLTDVIIQGNLVYDIGRDTVIRRETLKSSPDTATPSWSNPAPSAPRTAFLEQPVPPRDPRDLEYWLQALKVATANAMAGGSFSRGPTIRVYVIRGMCKSLWISSLQSRAVGLTRISLTSTFAGC